MRYRRKISAAFVDPACPLDGSHPLNRNLISDWTIISNSGWVGGTTWNDLVRGLSNPNPATLTGGPTWGAAVGRPGGYGAITFVRSSSQYAAITRTGAGATAITYCAWVNRASTTSTQAIINNNKNLFEFNVADARWFSDTDLSAVSVTPTITLGLWYHIAVTQDVSNNYAFYLNGASIGSGTTNALDTGAEPNANIGRYSDGTRNFDGKMDAPMIYHRALSASEIGCLYAESARGNPERLRWVSTRSWSIPTGAAATSGLLRRRRRMMLMGDQT